MARTPEDKLNALVARVGQVRRWLVMLAILKVTALCLVFVSLYVGVYAWLDHRLNFDEAGRIAAFVLLVAGVVLLLHGLKNLLPGRISFSSAANYIENKRSFDQQLVTAIEYYENKHDYPYSKALLEQVVLHVDKDSSEFRFDSTVEKWKGYALAAVILLGFACAWFYVRDNCAYFRLYLTRLTRPLATVAPLPATSLESITRDIVTATDSEVTFAATLQGRIPEFGKLVLEREDTQGQSEAIELKPVSRDGKTTEFQTSRTFSQPGLFKYRFEAGSASTNWHTLSVSEPTGIESMTAEVMPPRNPSRREWFKPYTEHIESGMLEVIPGSSATLHVQATGKLKEVTATGPDGKPITKQLDGADQFTFHLNADRNGTVKFALVNEQGLANDKLPELQVILKTDEPAKFKLISPDGDYLATDVASVPITFEVTDDFGLDSVRMCLEIPGQPPQVRAIPVEDGTRSTTFTHTIELEEYELAVGDSILFHAEGTDIDTGSAPTKRTSSSEVYFIEIRPYRQNWRPKPGGPGQGASSPPVELLNILEYTRAIVKKTWEIAQRPSPTESGGGATDSTLDFIDNDVRYCDEQLAMIRDDSQYGFGESQKAVLNEVLKNYEQASTYLAKHDAGSAMAPEKEAYRILRRFILELDLELNPPSSGQSPQEEKPDSVRIQEKPEFAEYEKERLESELKKVQQEVDKLSEQQQELETTFENFLQEQAAQKKNAQNASTDKPQANAGEKQDQDKAETGSPGNSTPGQKAQNSSDSSIGDGAGQNGRSEQNTSAGTQTSGRNGQTSNETGATSADKGQSTPGTNSPGDGSGAGRDRGDRPTPGSGQNNTANSQARISMIQARQKSLQEQVEQLNRDLQQLPQLSQSGGSNARSEAQKHLAEAVKKMDDFQTKLAEARYQAYADEGKSNEALKSMASSKRELDMASEAIGGELTLSDEQKTAKEAQEMAEQLAQDADTFDESVTDAEREDMLARLEAAKRLLEMMPEPQWAQIDQPGGNRTGTSPVLTTNPNLSPAEQARQMARQFWSIAVNAKKRRSGPAAGLTATEPSDAKFHEKENEFFENAAKFDPETAK